MSHELILEGTLGVDARRAAKKIRDHLLANPATWLAELGRVAVLSGAKQLAIDLRASSIVVEWNGELIGSEVIAQFGRHLLGEDEEVKPAKNARRAKPDRRPELLTLAVFAALGDVAKAVDIRVAGEGDSVSTRRISRDELEGALTGAAARVLSVSRRKAFSLLPDATGAVELDLGTRLAAVAHWVGIAAPPAAVRELGARMGGGIAISVDEKPLEPALERPVLSFELPAVGELSVRIDLMARPQAEPRILYYELGFEIARSPLLEPTLALPIRVVVSGAHVPTNASRSQVDETVAENVRREALGGLPIACEGLRAAIVAALGRNDQQARQSLEQVAGYLAAAALRASPAEPFHKAFSPVLDWPLLQDAVGRPLGVRDAHRLVDGYAIHARDQTKPLAPEYASLVADVLWRRGTSAESAFELLDYDTIAEDVEAGVRRKQHLAANPMAFEPPPCATARARFSGVEEGGCEWRLTLDTASNGPCKVRLFVGDDLIETREVEHKSPFYRFDAAIRWPGVVVAERTLDRIRTGYGSGRMLAVLARVVNESLLKTLEAGAVRSAGPARTLALRMLAPSLEPAAELTRLPLWRRAIAGFMSTAELIESGKQRGHVFVINRLLLKGENAPNELLIVVPDHEQPQLRKALGDVPLVDYAPYANAPVATADTVKSYFINAKIASHSFKWREYFLAVAPATSGRHICFHRELLIDDAQLDSERGMIVATDGETTLREGALDHAEMLKQAWLSMIAWLAANRSRMQASLSAPGVRAALLTKLLGDRANKALPQLPFEEWPLFRLHTQRRSEHDASAAEILAHFAEVSTLPTVSPSGPYDTSIDCVVASEKDRAVLERVISRSCVPPRPPPRPAPKAPDSSEDVLSALRDIMPSAAAVEPLPPEPLPAEPPPAEPVPAKAPARPLPVAPPAAVKRRRPAREPAPEPSAAPVDPDDILGPIRHLMTQSVERQAAEEKVRLEKARAEAKARETAAALAAIDTPAAGDESETFMNLPKPRPPDTAWDKLVGLFKKPLQEVPRNHPLAAMSRRVTENLYVENLEIRFGQPDDAAVRFDRKTMTLVLNPSHKTVLVLVENGDVVPLVAAAFSEINRELKVISDEEERRALGRLLLDASLDLPRVPPA